MSSPFIQHASLDDIQERIPARSVNYGRNGGYNPPLVESPRSQTFTLTEEQQETPVLSRSDHIKFSADRKCDEPADNGIGAKEAGNSKWHQRGASEASVLERGRPMRRGDTSLMQRLSRAKLRGPSLAEENIGIPTGSKPREASTVIPIAELEFLKQQAYEQVESFEVLAAKDVSSLSKVCLFRVEHSRKLMKLRNYHFWMSDASIFAALIPPYGKVEKVCMHE